MAARMPVLHEERAEADEGPRHRHLLVVLVPEARGKQGKERNRQEHARERQGRPQRQRTGDVLQLRLEAGRRRGQEPDGRESGRRRDQGANRGPAADQGLPAIR